MDLLGDTVSGVSDPFRFCIYCEADCYEEDPGHADDCPSTTGVFPVREEDAGPQCPHCGERIDGEMHCADCDQPLRVGDHYTHRHIGRGGLPGMAEADVYEIICLGCAALAAVASD